MSSKPEPGDDNEWVDIDDSQITPSSDSEQYPPGGHVQSQSDDEEDRAFASASTNNLSNSAKRRNRKKKSNANSPATPKVESSQSNEEKNNVAYAFLGRFDSIPDVNSPRVMFSDSGDDNRSDSKSNNERRGRKENKLVVNDDDDGWVISKGDNNKGGKKKQQNKVKKQKDQKPEDKSFQAISFINSIISSTSKSDSPTQTQDNKTTDSPTPPIAKANKPKPQKNNKKEDRQSNNKSLSFIDSIISSGETDESAEVYFSDAQSPLTQPQLRSPLLKSFDGDKKVKNKNQQLQQKRQINEDRELEVFNEKNARKGSSTPQSNGKKQGKNAGKGGLDNNDNGKGLNANTPDGNNKKKNANALTPEYSNERIQGSSNPSSKSRNNNTPNNRNSTPQNNNNNTPSSMSKSGGKKRYFTPHISLVDAEAFVLSGKLLKGKLRCTASSRKGAYVLPFGDDAGLGLRDVYIDGDKGRNRGVDGDIVYVLLEGKSLDGVEGLEGGVLKLSLDDEVEIDEVEEAEEVVNEEVENSKKETWNDCSIQSSLWAPQFDTERPSPCTHLSDASTARANLKQKSSVSQQRKGRVVCLDKSNSKTVTIIGHIKSWSSVSGGGNNRSSSGPRQAAPKPNDEGNVTVTNGERLVLCPSSMKFPFFVLPNKFSFYNPNAIYTAVYTPTTDEWGEYDRFPKMKGTVVKIGEAMDVESETMALLIEHDVYHLPSFTDEVILDVEEAVKAGLTGNGEEWVPTADDLIGRKNFRDECIFTIDPLTAKDLDDALHIKMLPCGTGVEMGVHIADVSHFIKDESAVDLEARDRATTVYLVDRVLTMLPRPLCEIACSLNENVDRLVFSCIWQMNFDGTMKKDANGKVVDIWYGRGVIRSCARLDYGTAQRIIDEECCNSYDSGKPDSDIWDPARQPHDCKYTCTDVADKVRLMHSVAMKRRALRFANGALALNGVKLVFKLPKDGSSTPSLCEPYPIRDSNRLVEEYMLLANFLVAQRLITHGKGLGLLRNHKVPDEKKMTEAIEYAAQSGFTIDASTSQSMQESLNAFTSSSDVTELQLQTLTSLLTEPMFSALYLAAGETDKIDWSHFALNIPYYTHFTSPIRRYADVLVHRLLQLTLENEEVTPELLGKSSSEIHLMAHHCNEKKLGARKAQERSDRVFLSLYVKAKPILGVLAVVVDIGEKTFKVLIPSLGLNCKVFLDDHQDVFDTKAEGETEEDGKVISITPKEQYRVDGQLKWSVLKVRFMAELEVNVICKDEAPVDVRIRMVGPWKERKMV